MRSALGLLLAMSGVSSAPAHAANGVISLSWGACSPIVADVTASTAPLELYASVLGNDQTHNAYQVRFLLADASRTVPEAWRFDAAGCQGLSLLTIAHFPPASVAQTCPAFQGATTSLQIENYDFLPPNVNYPSSTMRGVLANTYPTGTTSNPGQRYFLAMFRFDHTYSVAGPGTPGVTCGGIEIPLCFTLLSGGWSHAGLGTSSYLRLSDGVEVPFDVGSNIWVTVNGLAGCPSVPAAAATWGGIKGVYRR